MMQNKKVILFDLDGTLIDTDKIIFMCYRYLFQKYGKGKEPSFSEYISFLGPALVGVFPKYFKEDPDFLVTEYRKYYHENAKYLLNTINGANEVVDELVKRGYKLGIVSLKIKNTIIENLEDLNLASYFSLILGCDELKGHHKPDPYGIYKAIDFFGVKKDEVVMIGDSLSDILCANNAGVTSIAVNYSLKGKFYEDNQVDYSINSLKDLLVLFPKRSDENE